MRTETRTGIERLLQPRSIAIVGISPQPGSPGAAILGNIERFGYAVELHFVSRNRTEVLGRPCVPTIDELPPGIDLALLLVPRAAVVDAMEACVRRGIGAAIVYASGFAELDDDGRAAQTAIAAIARENGIALLGPNCLGFVNYADGLPLSFSTLFPEPPKVGPSVAFVSQSGGTPSVARFALTTKSINVSYQISTGNEALLGIEDFLIPMLDQERNAAVAVFAEQLRSPERFLAAAEHARRKRKPIVLLHPGSSAAAQASARSHTGALVGDHALIRAIVEDAGVVMVDTIEELIDSLELLVRFETIPSRGPAIITDSGAFKSIALDFCENLGLPVPPFGPATLERLGGVVPDFVGRDNPIDVTAQAMVDTELYAKTIAALADNPATGLTLISAIHGDPQKGLARIRTMLPRLAETKSHRPGAIAMLAYDAEILPEVYAEAAAVGVPFFRSPERALRAVARVTRYGAFLERPQRAARTLPKPLALEGSGIVPEYRAKALLAAAGITVPRGRLVTDVAAAQAVAVEIGFPVVLKLQSAALAHKSDAGALALAIRDAAALQGAWTAMHDRVRAAKGDIPLDGVLVEVMAKPGVELIAGARRDPAWGTTILAGLGGIWAEVMHDTVVIPGAADEDTIVAALRRLRAAPLLLGARGTAPVDLRAAARALATLGALVEATPNVAEIEVNPLVLYAEGALALDALIVAL